MRKNVAVILSAGSGARSGFQTPKQLMKLAGKPVIEHTLGAFEAAEEVDEIAIVTSASCRSEIESLVLSTGYKKIKKILNGGNERWESSWAAIQAYQHESQTENLNLIFHDAVRPLVDHEIIQRVVAALEVDTAVDVVTKAVDTVVQTDEAGRFIQSIPDRSQLRSGQTPQGFHYTVIRDAYQKAIKDRELRATDDCGILLRYQPQEKIVLVEGSPFNQKLTYHEDLAILERLFQFKRKSIGQALVPNAKLQKCKDKVFVIIGGSSGIGEEIVKILAENDIQAYSLSRREGVDISNRADLEAAFDRIQKRCGRVDYVVNCAGLLFREHFAGMKYEDLVRLVNTNYLGALNVAYVGHEYLKQSRGSLLFFTSSSYTYGRAFYSVYSSSKAAVVNLTQALAEEWAPSGIRVNCMNPERTATPMRTSAFGLEPPTSLLSVDVVAKAALKVLIGDDSGLIVDVRKERNTEPLPL